jgi:hypothetical protein
LLGVETLDGMAASKRNSVVAVQFHASTLRLPSQLGCVEPQLFPSKALRNVSSVHSLALLFGVLWLVHGRTECSDGLDSGRICPEEMCIFQ